MRRNKALGGDRVVSFRVVPILLAGCVGYLLGSAHIEAFRVPDLSAAEAIAQRFPQDWRNASLTAATALRTAAIKFHAPKLAAATNAADAPATAREQFAMLDPEPMAPQADEDVAAPATVQTASADESEPPPASVMGPQPPTPPVAQKQSPAAVASAPAPATKVAVVAPHRPVNQRPGYMLNDAQIASIKERLHLTPDQEQMWPAVEAALRNMAYTHLPKRGRGTAGAQTAAVDPNAVQGLKSAAVPLILSFNDQQKDEVRNLVHVMGLDQLASQF